MLDGANRYLVARSLRDSMTEADIEILLQRAKEKFPRERSRIVSDNEPQFIAKDALEVRADEIHRARDRTLEEARERRLRAERNSLTRGPTQLMRELSGETEAGARGRDPADE